MIIADNGHLSRCVFIYCSVFFNATDYLCINAPFSVYTVFAEVKDVRLRSYDERTTERWKPYYSHPKIEVLSWINTLKLSFYTVSSTKIFPG